MRIFCMVALAITMFPLNGATGVQAQSSEVPSATKPPAPAVTEQAERLLMQMSGYIASVQQFTFHADILFDHVLPSGQKLQFSASEDMALRRPKGLYVQWSGNLGDRQFWYDGTSIYVL